MMVDNIFKGHILRIAVGITMLALIATGAAAGTDINSCRTISEQGEYVLNTSIDNASTTCISIISSNVILDGAGHTIDGTKEADTYGVYVYNSTIPLSNVTVKNLSVTNWDSGIYLVSSSNSTLTGNNASSNMNYGIFLNSSSSNNLTNNNAVSNYLAGIGLDSSGSNNLTGNNASSNTNHGIFLISSGSNNLTGNNASSNALNGIDLESSSNSNNLTGNTASWNIDESDGIYIDSSSNNNLTSNNASSNGEYGIVVDSSNNNNLISNNASSNAETGIDLGDSSNNNNLTSNNASSNGDTGIRLFSSSNNNLTNNNASSNGVHGISLYFSSNNNLTSNNASSNAETGIDLGDSSDNNNLTGNNASSNGDNGNSIDTYGIYLNSNNNTLSGNNASNNYIGIGLDSFTNNNTLSGNNANSNSFVGIGLESSSSNTLSGNNANSNIYVGIGLRKSSNNNTLSGNNANSNNYVGIGLQKSSNNNTLSGNNASNNTAGIRLESSSSNNILTGNNASSNSDGIDLVSSSNNNLTGNNASNNTLWAFYSASNSTNNTVTNLTINPTISFTGKDVAIKSNSSPAPDPAGYKNISKFINATNNSADSWLFLNVSYSNGDVAGLNESTLRMWRYNGSAWSLVQDTNNVDTVQKDVYANITRFSIFAPMGSLPFNISGYKINDTNGNGIWNSGEKGIQGWNITLKDATGNVINTTATDSAGFYQFTNITAGSYNVTEEDRDGWNHTNATLRAINLSQNITNLNFTNRRVFSVNTSTGTGTVYLVTDAGTIQNLISVNESDLPAAGKPNMQFPHGFLSFNITGLNLNQTVNVTIVFPSNIPITAQYWKYQTPGGWYQVPIGSNDGDNIITIQLQDGGIGDDIGSQDGKIVDPGAPGFSNSAKVPALNPAGLVALAGVLSFVAISRIRRRGK